MILINNYKSTHNIFIILLYCFFSLFLITCSCVKDDIPGDCSYDEPIAISIDASQYAYSNSYCLSFSYLNFCQPGGNWASSSITWDPKTEEEIGEVLTFLETCETSQWSPLSENIWTTSTVDYDAQFNQCYINMERYIKYETMLKADFRTRCGFCPGISGGSNKYGHYSGQILINKSITWKMYMTIDLNYNALITPGSRSKCL